MYEYSQTVNNSVRNTNEYKKKLKPDFKIFMQMGKIKQIKTSVPKFLCAVTCGSNPEFFLGGGGSVNFISLNFPDPRMPIVIFEINL